MTRKKLAANKRGLWAEHFAALFFRLKGYRLVARNYKVRTGEIDIIALKGNVIIFIEVKFRSESLSANYAIGRKQWKRIEAASLCFVADHPAYHAHVWRFDSILFSPYPRHQKDAYRRFD